VLRFCSDQNDGDHREVNYNWGNKAHPRRRG
jgi:hypothetical protein